MDSDELDFWLDDGAGDRTSRAGRAPIRQPGTQGSTAGPGVERQEPEEQRRPPWKWLGLTGAGVWAAVMVVVFLGGDGRDGPADGAMPSEGFLVPADTPTTTPIPAATATPAPTTQTPATTQPAVKSDRAAALALPAGIEAGAVAALRSRLTVTGPQTSYLEWAVPAAAHPLDAGVWLVVLDAIWLEGSDGTLADSRRGRWAVPIADDGRAMRPPWPHPSPPTATETPTAAPPSGTTRISEVAQALVSSGWREVDVAASDPHPLLDDVVVALVEGIPPNGDQASTEVLWLGEDADGTLVQLAVNR